MTRSHSFGSSLTSARTAAPKSSPAAAPMDWTWPSTCWSSSWKRILMSVIAGGPSRQSTEPARDVRLGPFVVRVREDLLRAIVLHEHARPRTFGFIDLGGRESRHVAYARGLLHVVGHDHDRVVPLELLHQILDACR